MIVQLLGKLDVVKQWVSVHHSVLERFQSSKYYGFHLFTTNANYANVFTSIMGILVQSPAQDLNSFISVTGIEKLDQLLNGIKTKTLECLNLLFTYLFDEVPNQLKKESPFIAKA